MAHSIPKEMLCLRGSFLFYKHLACLHTQANLYYKLLLMREWSQSIHPVLLCVHTGMLLRSGSFEAGGVTAAGIQDTVNHTKFITGSFELIRMEEALSYRTCRGVSSIHVVLGELDFCFPLNTTVQKAVWFHMRVKLRLLNTSSWDFTSQKWSTKVCSSSCHDIVARFSKQLGSNLLRVVTGSVFS